MDSREAALRTDILALSPERRALVIERLLKARGRSDRGEPLDSRHGATTRHPLSFAQQRLWLIHQMNPGDFSYNVRLAIRLEGELDATALKASLDAILARHSVLRSRFIFVDGNPIQEIQPAHGMDLLCVNLEGFASKEHEAERLLKAEVRRPFDLAAVPPVRGVLVRFADSDHLLLIVVHHIVADGFSLGVFARELSTLYQAYSTGQPSPLDPLPLQYADFVRWEREKLSGPNLDQGLQFWREQLADIQELRLPARDFPGDSEQRENGVENFTLDDETSEALMEYARQAGVSLFMLLMASFGVFLYRYSGLHDIVCGTIVQNRRHPGLNGVIGFFTNLLPLRIAINPERRFHEHLLAVRDMCLKVYAHQDIPFERIVEELKLGRNGSQQPFSEVIFTTALERTVVQLKGLRIKWVPSDSGPQHSDLFFTMKKTDHGLAGAVQYKTVKYEPFRIRRMIEHWRTLLKSIAARPNARLRDHHVITEAEQWNIAQDGNNLAREFPAELSVEDLFEEAATRNPDRLAVKCGATYLTYGELHRRSDRIACALRQLGVRDDIPVGLCIERSVETLIGLIAILKAGGAYVPLDPDHPVKRSAFIARDSGIRLLLTSDALTDRAEKLEAAKLFTLKELEKMTLTLNGVEPRLAEPDGAAYILYTSGSTGAPKGVVVTRRSLINCLTGVAALLEMNSDDVVAAMTTVTFDIAAVELLLPLTIGASVILTKNVVGQDPEEMQAIFSRERITTAQATPSAWRMLLALGCAPRPGMRIISGGEPLPRDLAARLTEPGATLWNGYGPTETTIYSTFSRVSARDGVPAIGRPTANTQALILDENLQIVPDGVYGDLYIGGQSLSRGYWNRPDLTAERFAPNPFPCAPGARLYRTGDLVRRRSDGQLQFLGRADAQVKLRGYRIELGEISSALRSYPGVRDCVVVLRDVDAEPCLAGYFVEEPNSSIDVSDLRNHLRSLLPGYMIPSALTSLPQLPLTPTGKIDERALPSPSVEAGRSGAPPQTEIELGLAKIWKEILRFDPAHIDENFFDLGGHSLLATQAIVRARAVFGADIPLRAMFDAPTIRTLAQNIERLRDSGSTGALAPVALEIRPTDIPLSFSQERLWVLDKMIPSGSVYTIAGAVEIEGKINLNALLSSLREIVRRHEALRTTFPERNGGPVQVIHSPAKTSVEVIDEFEFLPADERGHRVMEYFQAEAERPFDLANGPLFRARVVRLQPGGGMLLLAMHHIVADGWSIGLIIRELSVLYEAFAEGRPSPLPEPRLQYADFSLWQRRRMQGDILDRHYAYWSSRLDRAVGLEYPPDRPRPDFPTYQGDTIQFGLPPELASSLKALSRREGVTLFVLLLAAWKSLIHHHTGVTDIVIGAPSANRGFVEIEDLVGCFINTLPLRTDLSGNPTVREIVRRVGDIYAEAFERQDLPFEKMVEKSSTGGTGAGKLLRAMFILRNEPRHEAKLGDLILRQISLRQRVAKFDLTMEIREDGAALAGSIEYNVALYDRMTIIQMSDHFETLLRQFVENPDTRLEDLELMSEAQIESLRSPRRFTDLDQPPFI